MESDREIENGMFCWFSLKLKCQIDKIEQTREIELPYEAFPLFYSAFCCKL
jgi:hypothetical protein